MEIFAGGFLGVDVFFVISGYLITQVLMAGISSGNGSISSFMIRRIKRILPALAVVVLASTAVANIVLFPGDLSAFNDSVIASSIFSSNIYFWRQSGYFDIENNLKPLLHTWSLGVEMQFYILFAFFFFMVRRYSEKIILLLVGMGFVISFLIWIYGSINHPVANFFLLPTRVWEFLLGSLAAFLLKNNVIERTPHFLSELLSMTGLGLIFGSIFLLNELTPILGFLNLLPTVGTALILVFANSAKAVKSFLCVKPLVGVGLVSYSAYLWHQPVFGFARHRLIEEPDTWECGLLALLCLALAFISYKVIEIPFREGGIASRFSIGFGMFSLLVGISTTLYQSSIGEALLKKSNVSDPHHHSNCMFFEEETKGRTIEELLEDPCIYPAGNSANEVYIVGDSHASVLQAPVQQYLKGSAKATSFSSTGAPPFFKALDSNVAEFHRAVLARGKINRNLSAVILTARWSLYLRSSDFEKSGWASIPSWNPFKGRENAENLVKMELEHLIEAWLESGVLVIFVTDYPTNGKKLGRKFAKAQKYDYPLAMLGDSVRRIDYQDWIGPVRSVVSKYESNPLFSVVDSYLVACGAVSECPMADGRGLILSGDANHASGAGSDTIGLRISEILTEW